MSGKPGPGFCAADRGPHSAGTHTTSTPDRTKAQTVGSDSAANVVPLLFRAAARTTFDGRGLAIVTGVGYAGFLVGPPLVGFAANAVGLPRAMWLVVVGGLALAMGAAVLRRQTTFNCRAVLLDMDGTLVDSSEAVDAVWKEWAASIGVD